MLTPGLFAGEVPSGTAGAAAEKSVATAGAAAAEKSVATAVVGKSTPKGFTDDFDAARKAAEKSGKQLWVLFTGSDWCYWCQKLEKEQLSKPDFATEGAKGFELVFLDFPQDKSRVRPAAVKRNQALAKEYGIRGYPSIVIINSNGEKVLDAERPGEQESPKTYFENLRLEIKLQTQIKQVFGKFDERLNQLKEAENRKVQPEVRRIRRMTDRDAARAENEKLMKAAAARVLPELKDLQAELKKLQVAKELEQQKSKRENLLRRIIESIEQQLGESQS